MPFGLCNAPSTFQSLKNHMLKPYLRKFVLVFFDDILIYSRTCATHLQHVDLLLQLLWKHKLFVKMSKCSFGKEEFEYLGYIVGCEGYYHKFVSNYGHIARPLTQLLKKNSFLWNDEAQQAFVALKHAMCSTLVLALPDFTKYFVKECNASGTGIGAVLMQEGRTLAFMSQQLSGKNIGQSTYEKDMMAILNAVDT
eukprot:PITA_04512